MSVNQKVDGEELAESNPSMQRSIPLAPLLSARGQKAKGDETEFEAQAKSSAMSYMRGMRYGGMGGAAASVAEPESAADASSEPESIPQAGDGQDAQVGLDGSPLLVSASEVKSEQPQPQAEAESEAEAEVPMKAFGLAGRAMGLS